MSGYLAPRIRDPLNGYVSWRNMRSRCLRPTNPSYPNYGGRGITICKRWESFENFLSDMGPKPTRAHSLERLNNNRGYFPKNCTWATQIAQCNNQRSTRLIRFGGKVQSLSAWSREIGMSASGLLTRLQHGWSIREALTTTSMKCRVFSLNGITLTPKQWSKRLGVESLRSRFYRGWNLKDILSVKGGNKRNAA